MPTSKAGRAPNGAALRALAETRARALAPLIAEICEGGAVTPTEIAHKLNELGSTTYLGNPWSGLGVKRVMAWLKGP